MKKFLALLLALVMVFALAACGQDAPETTEPAGDDDSVTSDAPVSDAPETAGIPLEEIKVGFIFLHDENSTYDLNFINAAKAACEALGLSEDQYVLRTNVPEGQECYDAAADLADDGCNIVFADSFGHEDFMIQAAREFPEVQFCHATGTKAHTEGLDNFHNAFASIYEGRYLAGIAAGMKLNEMIEAGEITESEAKMGYVGAFPYAEVKSGMTSFYLGAKSVCPTVTMDVRYTNSWFDIAKEKEAATSLINDGCVVISQHADSEGAPRACEENNVPNVAYNISTIPIAPNTALISSAISWEPYFTLMIESAMNGEEIPTDYCATIEEGGVILTELNTACAAEGTQEAIDAAMEQLLSGELHVFDTANFTVGGETLTSYMADVDTDADFTPDTEAISDGYFHESEYRSAPYFDLDIDGITTK